MESDVLLPTEHMRRWVCNLFRTAGSAEQEAQLTADHLIVIGAGRMISQGSVAEVVANSSGSHVLVRSPEGARLASVLSANGAEVTNDADDALRVRNVDIARIGQLAADNSIVLHELSPHAASLEQAFMELTRDSSEFQTDPIPAPPSPSTSSNGGSN